MAVGDVYRLELRQLYAGQQLMNTLHFDRKAETEVTQLECQQLADDWLAQFKLHQMQQLSYTGWTVQQLRGSGVTYSQTTCQREGGLRFEGFLTMPNNGNQAGEGMPPQSAMVTTLSTGISGRRRRGRYYMSGFGENIQTDGRFGVTPVTDIQASWTTQLNKYKSDGTNLVWRLGVWSNRIATGCAPAAAHPHGLIPLDQQNPGDAFRPVVAVVVRNIVYTQRRRTIGVGS